MTGGEGIAIVKFVAAFTFVLSLMFLLAWAAKRFGWADAARAVSSKRRLKIVEQLTVDARRRLLLVRRDGREHLILTGPAGDVVVERDIPAAEALAENIVDIPLHKDAKNAQV